MVAIELCTLDIPGCLLIKNFVNEDQRGAFVKLFHVPSFSANGLELELKEVFYTCSRKGTLRGIHFQEPHQQAKLVHCMKGRILDVLVDLRPDSPTFRRWVQVELNDSNRYSIFIPTGIGHSYLALEDSTVLYCCNEIFYAADDTGIVWNDPDINIQWPVDSVGGEEKIILSPKDRNLPMLRHWLLQKKNNE